MKPLVFDLYCGLGGWSEGFLSEGYECIGFDIERHDYGTGGYPGQLVLQDVLTLHGSQFRNASCIVASPPCQAYSYRAMPWKRAKALPPPDNSLFDACFRIQREASEAAGRWIPLVVENVKGAQPWVGRAKAHYGSYYLWGDVESIGGRIVRSGPVEFGMAGLAAPGSVRKFNPDGSWFAVADSRNRGAQKREGRNFHAFENGLGSSPSFNGAEHETRGVKGPGGDWFKDGRQGQDACAEGIKQHGSGAAWFDKALDQRRREATAIKNGNDWFGSGENCSLQRRASSRSTSRKAASAQIAKIPFCLAQWIARCFKPDES